MEDSISIFILLYDLILYEFYRFLKLKFLFSDR